MTTTGYLILITALVIVAGVMVFTKFATRFRGRQDSTVDENPVNDTVEFTPAVISAAEEDNADSPDEEIAAFDELEAETPLVHADPIVAEDAKEEKRPAVDGYYDDLQEAAAGLAMLMRSSTSSAGESAARFVVEPEEVEVEIEIESTPDAVVEEERDIPRVETIEIPVEYGVEDTADEIQVAEAPKGRVSSEEFEIEINSTVPEAVELEAGEMLAVEVEETPVVEEEKINDLDSSEETILESVTEEVVVEQRKIDLGAEVTDRIEKIDSGLDALEELVASIEASLASFSPLTEELENEAGEQDGTDIPHAA